LITNWGALNRSFGRRTNLGITFAFRRIALAT
jgi:hypothetical protein